jgi:hypothetical protein
MPREDAVEVFYATLFDSNECHLPYCDFRHSLNVCVCVCVCVLYFTLDEINFPKNLGTFKINYFFPKLLESYRTS